MASLIRSYSLASLAVFSLMLFVVSGCNNDKAGKPEVNNHAGHGHAHGHEHEEMPETFAAAVSVLKEHAPEIKEAFEAGKSEDVHDALHFLGELSEKMSALIDASDLTDDQKAQAKETSEVLFDQYMELDGTLHDPDSKLKYEDVSGKIDESLATLEALVPAAN